MILFVGGGEMDGHAPSHHPETGFTLTLMGNLKIAETATAGAWT
jgi:hypothetical protein